MTDREIIRRALIDAIQSMISLAGCYAHIPDSPERARALESVAEYRRVLKKRYGSPQTPIEIAMSAGRSVSILDLSNARRKTL